MGAGVSVPATSANLGPGFDSFGLALDLHNEFEAELADSWSVEIEGEGAGLLSTGDGNQVARAMQVAFTEAGRPEACRTHPLRQPHPAGQRPRLFILGDRRRAAAGVPAARRGSRERSRVWSSPPRSRGIPTTRLPRSWAVSPCAGPTPVGREPLASSLPVAWRPWSSSATGELATSKARAMLPKAVPHADAAFNVAHAGLLAASIATGRPELLGAALADRLHEPYRASAVGDLQSRSRHPA